MLPRTSALCKLFLLSSARVQNKLSILSVRSSSKLHDFLLFYLFYLSKTSKMSDTAAAPATAAAQKSQKKKPSANHPKYSEMVKAAVQALKERGGSSRQAILKYIIKNYNVGTDEKSVNSHLKLTLRAGVKNNSLKQSKGTGAAGSFRIGEKPAASKSPSKKKPSKKPAAKPKEKKPVAKPKKVPAAKKPASAKKPKSPAKKSPTKPKKAAAKASKPKAAVKKSSPKKAARAKKAAKK